MLIFLWQQNNYTALPVFALTLFRRIIKKTYLLSCINSDFSHTYENIFFLVAEPIKQVPHFFKGVVDSSVLLIIIIKHFHMLKGIFFYYK